MEDEGDVEVEIDAEGLKEAVVFIYPYYQSHYDLSIA